MEQAVIVGAKRTPIGKYGGVFRELSPEDLAAEVIKDLLLGSAIDPAWIEDVILGNAAGPGGNLARVAALAAGLPLEVPGVTVDRQCGSGLEAIQLAAHLIQSGAGEIFLAGGVESTSRAPWKIEKPHSLYDTKGPRLFTRARFAPDFIGDPDMGLAAENVATRYHVTREQQDLYAFLSHQKALASQQSRRFQAEIVPITVARSRHERQLVDSDECPRPETSLEKLAALPPVFQVDGTVTAGNACPLNDGAAIVLMMSRTKAQELGLKPLLAFVSSAVTGVDPQYLGIGPVSSVQKLLARQALSVQDIDLVEFNEAFASQVIASLQELHIPWEKVNLGGGALALGHPYGASGAILVVRLCTEMQAQDYQRGLATLGIGGGMGLSALFERVAEF